MKLLYHLLISAAIAQCAFAGDHDGESPFGLTFSPSTVFASSYNFSGSVKIRSFPIPSESEYHTYYLKAIQNMNIQSNGRSNANTYYNSPAHLDANPVFKDIIDPVTTSLEQSLGHAPDTPLFSYPQSSRTGSGTPLLMRCL
jgi:hypothetical protein